MGLITESQFTSIVQDDWETELGEGGDNDEPQSAMAKWLDEYIQQRDYQKAMQRHAETGGESAMTEDFLVMDMNQPKSILEAFHWDDGDVWSHKAERLLARNSNLYRIPPTERGSVYCYLYKRLFGAVTAKMQALFRNYRDICDRIKTTRWENYIKAMEAEGIQILGCTTTGLVKYRGMLAAMKPRILLIEEAAETREANIAAALLPSLEQLVLVGDHQQLVPHSDMKKL